MLIDQDLCIQCESCVPYCPVAAIYPANGTVQVDQDQCVECNACVRANICPVEAMITPKLTWPRLLRNTFSDPYGKHESTQHMGRGTEEVKTNDVTGLVKPGEAGFAVEVGRPGISGSFADVEKVTMALAKLTYVQYAKNSPVTSLIDDRNTGRIREDILGERFLSAIIEFIVPEDEIPEVIDQLQQAADLIDSVFTVAIFTDVGETNTSFDVRTLSSLGLEVLPNGKTNLGLGKPLARR